MLSGTKKLNRNQKEDNQIPLNLYHKKIPKGEPSGFFQLIKKGYNYLNFLFIPK